MSGEPTNDGNESMLKEVENFKGFPKGENAVDKKNFVVGRVVKLARIGGRPLSTRTSAGDSRGVERETLAGGPEQR